MARILYFAKLVDLIGRDAEETDLPPSVSDVGTLLAWLRERGPRWNDALAEHAVKVTVNKSFTDPSSPVTNGDEIAIVSAHT
ncbi:MAG: hypothetical protein B7Z66_06730 [Chromatiales bacterium 21-64-14]|nr:MAG: hypothetical protein B7Z66_06730 [Chromatiales bacterium 21-64-14]HQU16678.1 MoaD/ThiS family protein [Gammaproteobacteria bacterium]